MGDTLVATNSPNVCPIISADTCTTTCFFPLYTVIIRSNNIGGTLKFLQLTLKVKRLLLEFLQASLINNGFIDENFINDTYI